MENRFFSGLFGNAATKTRLANALQSGTLPHAFLIDGPRGSGKHTLALELAAAILCERRSAPDDEQFGMDLTGFGLPAPEPAALPCHECNTCRRILSGNFTDVKILGRTGGKATIGVDDVRLFREDVYLSPSEAAGKVYIIEDAETLTVQAQNALLILLEEPPRAVTILMLANTLDGILPTIKSRTQHLSLERFSPDALGAYLTERDERAAALSERSPATFSDLILSSDGRIGAALELFDEKRLAEIEEERDTVRAFLSAVRVGAGFDGLYKAITALPQKRPELIATLELTLSALRDLILIKNGDTRAEALFFASREEGKRFADTFTKKRLYTVYDRVSDAANAARQNANVVALLTDMAAKIKGQET